VIKGYFQRGTEAILRSGKSGGSNIKKARHLRSLLEISRERRIEGKDLSERRELEDVPFIY